MSSSTIVSDWFGPHFSALYPLLQELHLQGGMLKGEVQLGFGRGAAGWLGRRLARKMGLPARASRLPLQVDISHSPDALVWARQFGGEPLPMVSQFEPIGRWPDGHWRERTGALRFKLTVDVQDGGWSGRVLGASLHGLPVPVGLLPRSHAFKRVEGGAYRFEVALIAPVLGRLLSYGGLLQCQARAISAPPSSPADSRRPESGAGESAG